MEIVNLKFARNISSAFAVTVCAATTPACVMSSPTPNGSAAQTTGPTSSTLTLSYEVRHEREIWLRDAKRGDLGRVATCPADVRVVRIEPSPESGFVLAWLEAVGEGRVNSAAIIRLGLPWCSDFKTVLEGLPFGEDAYEAVGWVPDAPATLRFRNREGTERDVDLARPSRWSKPNCTEAEISEAVDRRAGELRYCYERELANEPNLSGKVGVSFLIDPSGTVSKARIDESTLQSKPAEDCMLGFIQKWLFAGLVQGGDCVVSYHWVFEPPRNCESSTAAYDGARGTIVPRE
jgi:hypothetical protein